MSLSTKGCPQVLSVLGGEGACSDMALGIFSLPRSQVGTDQRWSVFNVFNTFNALGAAGGIQPWCTGSTSRQQACQLVGWLGGATRNMEGTRVPEWWWVCSRSVLLLFPQSLFDNKFDDIFGSSFSSDPFNFNSQNGMNKDDK